MRSANKDGNNMQLYSYICVRVSSTTSLILTYLLLGAESFMRIYYYISPSINTTISWNSNITNITISRYCCVYWRTYIIIYWYNTTGWTILNRKNAAVCKPDNTTPELYLYVCILFLFSVAVVGTAALSRHNQDQNYRFYVHGCKRTQPIKTSQGNNPLPSHPCEVKSKQNRQGTYGVPM